jgi:formamidase
MATHEIRIDHTKTLADEPGLGHNRWHPDIPPVLTIKPGDEVLMETRDGCDMQVTRDSSLNDVANLDLNTVHPLTGPVYVKDAEPGDLLVVNILEIVSSDFGFTLAIPGLGYLRDLFTEPFLAK